MSVLRPVRESILEINYTSWTIGDKLLLVHRDTQPLSGSFWSDGRSGFYAISEACYPLTQTRPLSRPSPIQKVHDADSNVAWKIGTAFLKIQIQEHQGRTREHTTLNYLHDTANGPAMTFKIPRVLYHDEFNGRYYLVTTPVPGVILEKAWQTMDGATKQACVEQVVDICKELALRQNDKICGIDGRDLEEDWLIANRYDDGYSPETMLASCKELGMKCDTFVLHHCDMNPRNVLVDLTDGCKVGIIDWEVTGFVPKEWIRTKFRVSWTMDFDFPGNEDSAGPRRMEWRSRVHRLLAHEGFHTVADTWRIRYDKRHEEKGDLTESGVPN